MPKLDLVYVNEQQRRLELNVLSKEELINLLLQAEEDAIEARYSAMGDDL